MSGLRVALFHMGSLLLVAGMTASCGSGTGAEVVIDNGGIRLEFDRTLASRVTALRPGQAKILGPFRNSEYLLGAEGLPEFRAESVITETLQVEDRMGSAVRTRIVGEGGGIRKEVLVDAYPEHPNWLFVSVSYTNLSPQPMTVRGWVSHHYRFDSDPAAGEPHFWSFQPGSYEDRRDWVQPLRPGFEQGNFLGMNASDYGGGTPVVDVWRRDIGLAVGHVEPVPLQVALPVKMDGPAGAELSIRFEQESVLEPGEVLGGIRTFVAVHQGDFFATLSMYRTLMHRLGTPLPVYPESAYLPTWCAWGYERDFTVDQVVGTLPKVQELGLGWAVLDDGWQTAEGDWYLNPAKFPRGDADMRRLTAQIRDGGLRPKIWWAPLAVDPGTDLHRRHPDLLLLDASGQPQRISWWDAWYLCPAYPPVREYTVGQVRKFIADWGFDGLKIDGQHLNGAPPCYNPSHRHQRPEESVEALPQFFREIHAAATSLTPDAGIEICPCGTSYSFFTMPYMNQPVASDPLNSWQIRLKGKVIKALMGSRVPYSGDHVEMSDGGEDFASTVGIGGVPSTKFTWPPGAKPGSEIDLTPEREVIWKKWLTIYRDKMLPFGEYRGDLYDLGFDRPETHVVAKSERFYFAFFSPQHRGPIELRGLADREYQIMDYVEGRSLGTVRGPSARLEVEFAGSLLLEASPQ